MMKNFFSKIKKEIRSKFEEQKEVVNQNLTIKEAIFHQEQGNKFMRENNVYEAIRHYTKSIVSNII